MPKPPHLKRLSAAAALLVCVSAPICNGQTLSRPGWAGSGMTASSWWRSSLLYQADIPAEHAGQAATLKSIATRLDDLRTLGVDGLLLSGLSGTASASGDGSSNGSASRYLDPALGTVDDFDDLLRQAISHDVRLLVVLSPELSDADLESAARFWLNRGIAGLRLPQGKQTSTVQAARLQRLRMLLHAYVGERVVIGDLDPAASSGSRAAHGRAPEEPQLAVLPLAFAPNVTASLRTAMQESSGRSHDGVSQPVLDAVSVPPELSRIAATVVLGGPDAALLHSGQVSRANAAAPSSHAEPDGRPDALSTWYRQMSVLHHSNPALRHGTTLILDHDAQGVLAWVVKPQQVSAAAPPLVFVCNLSDKPVQLSLHPDMQGLHLRGSFLRTVLRSDDRMGPMNLDSVTLQPYGVYIGELRF